MVVGTNYHLIEVGLIMEYLKELGCKSYIECVVDGLQVNVIAMFSFDKWFVPQLSIVWLDASCVKYNNYCELFEIREVMQSECTVDSYWFSRWLSIKNSWGIYKVSKSWEYISQKQVRPENSSLMHCAFHFKPGTPDRGAQVGRFMRLFKKNVSKRAFPGFKYATFFNHW